MTARELRSERILRRFTDEEVGQRVGWMAVNADKSVFPYAYDVHVVTATVSKPDAYVMAAFEGEERVVSEDLVYGLTSVRALSASMIRIPREYGEHVDIVYSKTTEQDDAAKQALAFQAGASGDLHDTDVMQWIGSTTDAFTALREQAAGQPYERLITPMYYRYNLSGETNEGELDPALLPDPSMVQETLSQAETAALYANSIGIHLKALRNIHKLAPQIIKPVSGIPFEKTSQYRAIKSSAGTAERNVLAIQQRLTDTIYGADNFDVRSDDADSFTDGSEALLAALAALSAQEHAARLTQLSSAA